MPEMFDEISRILAARMPRREAFRLFAGMVTAAFAQRYLPFAEAQFQACGLANSDLCSRQTLGKVCPGTDCLCSNFTTCCGTGGELRTKCCSTEHVCCTDPTGANGCCCIPQFEDCDPQKGLCVPKPRISLFRSMPGPPAQILIEVRDLSGRGLTSITVVLAVNVILDIPPLTPGTTSVIVTATKIDQGTLARVILRACAYGCIEGDPVLTELRIGEDRRAEDSYSEIPADEHFLIIQNGDRGLRKVEVLVNGRPAATRWLRDRVVRTIDLAAFMKPGRNTVTVTGNGRPRSSALVLIADTPGPDSGAKRFQRLIEWKPGADPGVNLHWGN